MEAEAAEVFGPEDKVRPAPPAFLGAFLDILPVARA